MRIFRANALKACIGILIAVLVTVNIGAAQAFDPNSANPQGDGVINYVNVDTSAGKVITNFEYEVSLGNAIELSDGNVLLSGYMRENWEDSDSGNCNFIRSKAILVKLTPKGRLVTSFADGGVFTYERLDTETFGQTVEDSSGNIYVIGGSTDFDLTDSDLTNGCDVQSSNPFILKINATGTLNSSFGSSGSVVSIPGIDNLTAIALSGERLILSSSSYPEAILFALNRISGSVDSSFGVVGNGKIVFTRNSITQITQILVQDKIYLFGDKYILGDPVSECRGESAILQWAINAVTLDGKPIDSFTNRPCGTSFSNGFKEGAYSRVFYRSGSIYVIDGVLKTLSGNPLDRYDTKLLKIDGQGNIDTGYSKLLDSYLTASPFSLTRTSYGVQSRTMDKDGRLIISYNYNSGSNAIVRIDENGLPDTDFGYLGKLQLGEVPELLYLENGTLFAFVNYSSNPTASLYVYNIETLRAKRQPSWSNYQETMGGFTVQITNHDNEFSYSATSNAGKASINATGLVTVTGLRPDQSVTVTVTTTRTGYASGSGSITGRAQVAPMLPTNKPTVTISDTLITCTIGSYSATPTSTAFSLFVDGVHTSTIFSSLGEFLPDWIIPWATSSSITRTATLTSASWAMSDALKGKAITCATLAYSKNATGLTASAPLVAR